MRIEMPDYVRCGVTFYVVSQSTGLQAAVKLDGARYLNDETLPDGLAAAVAMLNGVTKTSDARPMTAGEVTDYILDQEGKQKPE